jgi:hypothetical protein
VQLVNKLICSLDNGAYLNNILDVVLTSKRTKHFFLSRITVDMTRVVVESDNKICPQINSVGQMILYLRLKI